MWWRSPTRAGSITRYGHLSGFLAKEGQAVNTGTPIAKVGSTGRSTGPHLHFEVRKSDAPVDPTNYLNAGKRSGADAWMNFALGL